MGQYYFPTSKTEGENYFVQFDIYNLEFPIKKSAGLGRTPVSPTKLDYGSGDLTSAAAGQGQTREVKTAGFMDAVKNLAGGVTIDVGAIKDSVKEWQNTYNYKQQASELLHSIQLPLQIAPTESTSGTYADESTRDFQTLARVMGGQSVSAEEAQGLIQDETVKSIGKHLNRMQGKVMNQAQESFYTGPSKRDYAFNFSLIARNFEDSKVLSKIIRRFHYHAAPGHDVDKIFWSYPQMVRFLFLDKDNNRINLFSHTLDKINNAEHQYASKACFISNVTAEYGVGGDQLRFLDEAGKRTGVANVKLTVNLKEAEYFTKGDYDIEFNKLETKE